MAATLDLIKFEEALKEAEQCGFLQFPELRETNYATFFPTVSHSELALFLSQRLGGQLWPASSGVTWSYGRNSLFLGELEDIENILLSRSVVARLKLTPKSWNFGALSRQLVNTLEYHPPPANCAKNICPPKHFGFYYCKPGHYDNISLYDIKSCYYQLLRRMETLGVTESEGKLQHYLMNRKERNQLGRVVEAVGDDKRLRNSMIGALYGGDNRAVFFHKGEQKYKPFTYSRFRNAGALIIRSAYEIMAIATHEEKSVYTAVDCIGSQSGNIPEIWQYLDLPFRRVAHGEAHIKTIGLYRIGSKKTESYTEDNTTYLPEKLPKIPEVLYFQQWLRPQGE